MFSKIIVTTDLSDASDRVIKCVKGLQTLGAKEVILAHALGLKHFEVMKYELARLIEPRIRHQKAILESDGFETSVEILGGLPGPEIKRLAKEKNASLIMVGSHGATLAKDVLIGSAAFEIINSAAAPVFVMRLQITEEDTGKRCEAICGDFMKNILYATDFSDTAERAFSYLEKLVEKGAKNVTLLHVQDKVKISGHLEHRLEEFNQIDKERMERLKAELIKKGAAAVKIEIPYGYVIQEILKRAKEEDYSLIVMGSQGRGFVREIFMGSISHNVLRHSFAPLLLVPALR